MQKKNYTNILYRYRENRYFTQRKHINSNKKNITKIYQPIFRYNMCFDMTNIWYKGFSADRCGSSPTALIKIRKIENFTLGKQYGYENTRQSKLVQKNIIICQFQQPVFRKLVISVNFYLQSSWNYNVILKIYFSGFSNIFYNYIYYHHTKFRIDIICLKKVTGGSFSWNTALALLLLVKIIVRSSELLFLIWEPD